MTIAEYLEYEKKVNENHISNTKLYPSTYFGKSTPTHDPIREFAHYFDPNQLGTEFDCDLEDMEEEVEYMTNDEVVMSEQEESNHGYTQKIQHFEEKDDVDEWLNAKITKHMTSKEVSSIASNGYIDTRRGKGRGINIANGPEIPGFAFEMFPGSQAVLPTTQMKSVGDIGGASVLAAVFTAEIRPFG
ncbi:hypothetical protein Tco_0698798 [Tanacetum coccineum]